MAQSIAFVIEWENARLSELSRARQMLQTLHRQIVALRQSRACTFEMLVLRDASVDPEVVTSCLRDAFAADDGIAIRCIATEHLDYYQQKNFGARNTSADIIVFLDSDVIPCERWLADLIAVLDDSSVEVVCGKPFMCARTAYEKAFALSWFYGTPESVPTLRESATFPANNVAFRRDVILANPFPDLPSFRGSCVELARSLRARGRRIYMQERALVEHPPPNGLAHFVARALVQGHDTVVNRRARHAAWLQPLDSLWRYVKSPFKTLARVIRDGHKVDLRPWETPVVVAVAIAYASLRFLGEIVSFVNPDLIRTFVSL